MRLRNLFFIPLLALFGCAANDPYEYEKQQQAKISEPNAMTRAVMGLPSPDHREPLTGPMGGGGYNSVDHYMKQQEAALKKELQDSGVRIERVGGDIRLVMPGNITFATDSARLDNNFLPVLDSVAAVLAKYDQTELVVTGHTDSKGKEKYNQRLSKTRADSVAGYLKKIGLNSARIKIVGKGEKRPIASNKTEKGRASNRRVELDIRARR